MENFKFIAATPKTVQAIKNASLLGRTFQSGGLTQSLIHPEKDSETASTGAENFQIYVHSNQDVHKLCFTPGLIELTDTIFQKSIYRLSAKVDSENDKDPSVLAPIDITTLQAGDYTAFLVCQVRTQENENSELNVFLNWDWILCEGVRTSSIFGYYGNDTYYLGVLTVKVEQQQKSFEVNPNTCLVGNKLIYDSSNKPFATYFIGGELPQSKIFRNEDRLNLPSLIMNEGELNFQFGCVKLPLTLIDAKTDISIQKHYVYLAYGFKPHTFHLSPPTVGYNFFISSNEITTPGEMTLINPNDKEDVFTSSCQVIKLMEFGTENEGEDKNLVHFAQRCWHGGNIIISDNFGQIRISPEDDVPGYIGLKTVLTDYISGGMTSSEVDGDSESTSGAFNQQFQIGWDFRSIPGFSESSWQTLNYNGLGSDSENKKPPVWQDYGKLRLNSASDKAWYLPEVLAAGEHMSIVQQNDKLVLNATDYVDSISGDGVFIMATIMPSDDETNNSTSGATGSKTAKQVAISLNLNIEGASGITTSLEGNTWTIAYDGNTSGVTPSEPTTAYEYEGAFKIQIVNSSSSSAEVKIIDSTNTDIAGPVFYTQSQVLNVPKKTLNVSGLDSAPRYIHCVVIYDPDGDDYSAEIVDSNSLVYSRASIISTSANYFEFLIGAVFKADGKIKTAQHFNGLKYDIWKQAW